jgi:hypothetical protein
VGGSVAKLNMFLPTRPVAPKNPTPESRMRRAKSISKNPDKMPEEEYRFDKVPAGEQEDCWNYELAREFKRKRADDAGPAWLTLTTQQKQAFRSGSRIDFFGDASPVAPYSEFLTSATQQVVQLPPFVVDWSYEDGEIVRSQSEQFQNWIAQSRTMKPTPGRARRGRPRRPMTLLTRLAAWRLDHIGRFSIDEIEDHLQPLLIAQKININRNLDVWCADIAEILA